MNKVMLNIIKSRKANLLKSSSAFPTGTSDTNTAPISFVDNSVLQLAFNGSASGNIINPQFKSTGKNLFNPAVGTVTASGVTCTVAADGTITLNGTPTASIQFTLLPALRTGYPSGSDAVLFNSIIAPYTFSKTIVSGTITGGIMEAFVYAGVTALYDMAFNASSLTHSLTGQSITNYRFYIPSGAIFTNYTFKLQFEQNTVATAWEQYKQSLLAITGTITSSDRLIWDGATGKLDGSVVTTSGSLVAYQNGWIFVQNTNIFPTVTYVYRLKLG